MTDKMNNVSTENQEVQKESAGCFGLGLSFFIPLIGIILYFVKKSEKFDASGYLYAAGAGFLLNLFLSLITAIS